MGIEFQREVMTSRFLDPAAEFREKSEDLELRTDPLTGRQTMVYNRGFRRLPPKDMGPVVSRSLDRDCPFCPENIAAKTSRFVPDIVPEGRLRYGDAWLIPNIRPYNPYSAVLVLTREHFVAINDFSADVLVNGFLGACDYISRISEYDPRAAYYNLGWNYMPASGGSILHPHFQPDATLHPMPLQRTMLAASRDYARRNGSCYWEDLLTAEQENGERYIGRSGKVHWLLPFVPRNRMMDVIALFPGRATMLDITTDEYRDFAVGLNNVLQYMHSRNFYSFNLLINSGRMGEGHFWTQARIVPRMTYMQTDISDCNYHDTLQEMHFASCRPEMVCPELREYFMEENIPC
jgi:UDPglucose--hexose-1-phosphate uridylyltransferase